MNFKWLTKTSSMFFLFCLLNIPVSYADNSGPLTAHSNLFVTPTHGGLAWTSDKLLGHNVLILHSYHEDEKRTYNLNQGIRQTFNDSGKNIRYWIEYLDTKRFPYKSNLDNLKKVYKYKYSNKRLDAVIVTNNPALEFALQNRVTLFYGTPIIFTDVRNFDLAKLNDKSNITGILEQEADEIYDTVELALKLHPKTEKVVLLSPGLRDWSIANTLKQKYKNKVTIEFYNKYFMSDIEKIINKLDKNNIILTTTEPRTKAGAFVPFYVFNERLASISESPVYSISDTALGSGIVGGKLISGEALGHSAAQMVMEILAKKPADNISIIEDSPNFFMFDFNQLKRFNIKEAQLPSSSIIINKPFSIYNSYRNEINIALTLLIIQAAMIFLLVIVNRKRKLAELNLKDVNENLEQRVLKRSKSLTESNQKLTKEIEDRKKIETALRRSEEKYSKALLSSADAIIITSLFDSKIVEVNEKFEQLSGYSRKETIGKTGLELGIWADQKERNNFFRLIGSSKVINNFESDFRSRSGEILTMSLSAEIFEYQFRPHIIIISRDITEQKKANTELKRYEQIISSTKDFMAFVNTDYIYSAVNQAYLDAFNKKRDEIIGLTVSELHSAKLFNEVFKPNLDKCLSGQTVKYQHWMELSDRKMYFLDIIYTPYFEENDVTGVVVSARDITSTKKLSEQLQHQATHDELTDLINRREFEKRVNHLLSSKNLKKNQHVLCYMDLDQFKIVNDTFGHAAGDKLLKQLGALLKDQVRQRDTLARLGGDEFVALFEYCSLNKALKIVQKLQKTINDFRFVWESKTFNIGVSIGLVEIPNNLTNVDELLKQADTACYMAKTDGRNCIRVYEDENEKLVEIQGIKQWFHPVHESLENDSFKLYKQSIVSLNSEILKQVHFQEILIRMDKEGELILPGLFLPTVEQYGLSSKLDSWVVSRAFDLLENHPNDEYVKYFINLSGLSLSSKELLSSIESRLDANPDLAKKVCFEITETAAISNYTHATNFIDTLRERGCEFALDDFGSGFSSFAYLKKLKVDYLKIDGLFIKDIIHDPLTHSMVKSINEIGHISGIKTIAEFVENEEILNELKEIGIDFAQGYGIGIPQPIDMSNINKKTNKYISQDQKVVPLYGKQGS